MTKSETNGPVLLHRVDHILVVTINRVEAHNAINLDVFIGLGEALELAEHDPDIWVVVVTGAGDKAFSAGADLKALSRGDKLLPDDPRMRAWGFAGFVSHPISKPLIAAVNGMALGGGAEIVLACDLVVMAEHATIGLPEVKRGVHPSGGGAFRLAQQLPPKIAMELLLTGEPLSADRALEWGLVNLIAPSGAEFDTALALAARIAANAPLAVQATKRIAKGIVGGRVSRDDADWRLNEDEGRILFRSEDAREGPRAFVEKRAPRWAGR